MPSVLAVDDSKSMRHMMSITLSNSGFEVIKAHDGEDALAKAIHDQPDVVVADIDMPNMGGLELVRQFRTDPRYKNTPILVLSTDQCASTEEKAEAKAAGATGWMCKPLNAEQLVDTVHRILS